MWRNSGCEKNRKRWRRIASCGGPLDRCQFQGYCTGSCRQNTAAWSEDQNRPIILYIYVDGSLAWKENRGRGGGGAILRFIFGNCISGRIVRLRHTYFITRRQSSRHGVRVDAIRYLSPPFDLWLGARSPDGAAGATEVQLKSVTAFFTRGFFCRERAWTATPAAPAPGPAPAPGAQVVAWRCMQHGVVVRATGVRRPAGRSLPLHVSMDRSRRSHQLPITHCIRIALASHSGYRHCSTVATLVCCRF